MDEFTLNGRRALVTGSSEGIGAAIARRLAAAGSDVVLHGIAPDARMEAMRCDLIDLGRKVDVVFADLADPESANAVLSAAGCIDILVSNVAVEVRQPIGAIDVAAVELQVAVNLRSAFRLIQGVLPQMRARGWGRIVTIGSVQEFRPHPDMIVYAALKAAQTSLVRNVARQVAADGVTVNTIAPGVVVTRRNEAVLADEDYAARVRAAIPAGRFGTPEEIAGAALLLCSEAGRYITGANIPVDGGMHL